MKRKLTITFGFLLTMTLGLIITSCGEYDDEYDFRNHLRDMHPYSEIKKLDFGFWMYQVNDTIKGEVWIYDGAKEKRFVEKSKLVIPKSILKKQLNEF